MSDIREKGIEKELNDLFHEAYSFRNTQEFKNLMGFISRRSRMAPYNSYLLYLQKPDLSYAATRVEWRREARTVRKGARPLLILRPFGPVDLAYDVADTDGTGPFDLARLDSWKSEGRDGEREMRAVVANMERLGLRLAPYDLENIAGKLASPIAFGLATRVGAHTRTVSLRPGADLESLPSFFAVLVHEYAHHLLGHLGACPIGPPGKDGKAPLRRARTGLGGQEKEWEADMVAYVVCRRLGVQYKSVEYLASHLETRAPSTRLAITEIVKAANLILRDVIKG